MNGADEKLKDFRRADFSCQWKRNMGKMVARTAMSGRNLRREPCYS